ncbi:YraN family protein [Microbacterium koreense]|uniref:UPF0102 protein ACFQZV_08490 n=1 Tax=Microbacterium koreense TaxID=323761 RepID=A0ABW2ZSW9_9MICO
MAAKDDLGRAGEERAAEYLHARGYTVLDRNWRCQDGEVDIVAAHEADIVFVEVKTRRGFGFGHPFEAIDARKRTRMWRVAMAWIAAHRHEMRGRKLRFAAVGLTGTDPATASLEMIADLDVR